MYKIKELISHPYCRVMMVAIILVCLLNSCAYGPEHGSVALADNPFSEDFQRTQPASNSGDPDDFTVSDLRYQNKILTLSHNGRCMMECQTIDASQVQAVLDLDEENANESTDLVSSGECPRRVYDGEIEGEQKIRVILGVCDDDPKIIEIIDLNDQKNCDCE